MAAITQRIDNYLGGVSRQSDDKKKPGQVRECLNAYPDPTFGLTKRPGIKWITNLATGTTHDNSKWFYIHRDADEKYVGCITPASVAVTTNGTGSGTAGTYTDKAIASTSGTGTGMTVDVVIAGGVATKITINAVGTGYSNGDTITIAKANVGNTTADVVGTITLGDVDIWNATSGTACTITYGTDAREYLTGTRSNYDILTVQDTSIITNNLTVTDILAAPSFTANTQGTLALNGLVAGSTFDVSIKISGTTHSISTYTAASDATYDVVLTGLESAINGLKVSAGGSMPNDVTVTKYKTTLKITYTSTFTLSGRGGAANDKLEVFQDLVANVSDLPPFSYQNHVVKIINTASADSSYFAKFLADDGVSGTGYWEETIDPAVSTGFNAATMPHELVNTGTNTFTFRRIVWNSRLVGDDVTNDHPSFKGFKIQQTFYHSNRLGFLSNDNVILSRSGEYFNFYNISAQVQAESDPVDLRCTTIRPAVLHGVLPTTQGLVLFSKNQQFLMASNDGILTPSTTVIKTISNYEMSSDVDPIDMGTNINFISKTPSYTRVFGMVTRGQEENPQILDVGRVVNEWIPSTIDTLVGSPQNQFIAMSDQNSDTVYFYRTYSDGQKMIVQSWFRWKLSGTVQTLAVDSDEMFVVTKQGSQFTLSKCNLSQSPDDAIIVSNQGNKVNPCMDLYAPAKSVAYQSVQTLTVTAGGSGYTSAPTVTITGSGVGPGAGTPGSGATATATVSGGAVTALTLTNGGSAYQNGAVVTFSGGGGSGATATAAVLDGSKCYIEYENVTTLTPVIIVGGSTATGQFIESGFTLTPDIGSDGVGTYFIVPRKDLTSVASDVYTGWKYDLDVELPKTYYYLDTREGKTDFTAVVTVARMKFAVGLSGVMSFKLKSIGTLQGSKSYTGDGSTTDFSWIEDDIEYIDRDQIKVKINNVIQQTTDFSFVNDTTINIGTAPANGDDILIYIDEWYNLNPTAEANTYLANDIALSEQSVFSIPIHQKTDNFQLRVWNDSPFPVSLNSMMWEGNYTPRYYRRA